MTSVSYRHFTGRSAENYQRYFVPLIATPVSKDLLLAAALLPGERVLDVACGTGHVTRATAEQVGSTGTVTGVDIAPDMIEVAQSVPVPGGADIDWQVADAAALPIPDASVDVVLCQMGLMFMENRVAAVAEMRRVLAPSGRLVINTPGRIPPFFEALERAIVEHISADLGGFVSAVFSMHDPEDVAALLREAGLRGRRVEGVDDHAPAARARRVSLEVHRPDTDGHDRRAGFRHREVGVGTPVRQRSAAARADGVTVVELPMVVATARP